jgi:hypothetical protein
MSTGETSEYTWASVAGFTGTAAVLAYFLAAFLPAPDAVSRLLAFAFGPLLSISFLGMYRFMARHHDGPILQIACLSGIIAGVLVTTMLVVQVGNNMIIADGLAEAQSESARDAVRLAGRAVNRVQYLIDVVWDIFICIGTGLLGWAMLAHPRFGKIWGGIGIAAAALLLFLNLYTFPTAPAYAGSVDVGPLLALWCLAVFVRMLFMNRGSPGKAPIL